jgi:hypothetical protein
MYTLPLTTALSAGYEGLRVLSRVVCLACLQIRYWSTEASLILLWTAAVPRKDFNDRITVIGIACFEGLRKISVNGASDVNPVWII